MENILVFGATGDIGGRIASNLTQNHATGVRLSSSSDAGVELLEKRFPVASIYKADYCDAASLGAPTQGVDRIFVVTPDFMDEVTAMGNLIEAARANPSVKQIVRIIGNVPGVNMDELPQGLLDANLPEVQHQRARRLLSQSGLPVTFINTGAWYMKNFIWMVGPMIRDDHILPIPGPRTLPYLDTRDVADVATHLLTHHPESFVGECFNLTGPERLSFGDCAAIFSEELGFSVVYRDDPEPMLKAMGPPGEKLLEYLAFERPFSDTLDVTEDVERLLGRPPRSFRDWVRDNRDYFLPS